MAPLTGERTIHGRPAPGKPRDRFGRAPLVALALALAPAACSGADTASAEPQADSVHASAVIIESNSARFSVGASLAAGSALDLASGETVVLMHRSGAVRAYDAPGNHPVDLPEDARISTARAAMAALMSDAPRPEIGATRTFDYEGCLEAAETGEGFAADLCDELLADHAAASELSVQILSAMDDLTPGAPISVELMASFDAYVRCTLEDAQGAPVGAPLDIGRETAGAVLVDAGVVVHAPLRGAPRLTLSAAPGEYRFACTARDAALWRDLARARGHHADSALEDTAWLTLVDTYAALVGAKSAKAAVTVHLAE